VETAGGDPATSQSGQAVHERISSNVSAEERLKLDRDGAMAMAATDIRKMAAATMAAGVLLLSVAARTCRVARSAHGGRVMSAYPHLAGEFAL
jgi:hypothetical protein